MKKAQIKFETYIDPIQFGSRLLEVKTVKDYPRMIHTIDHATWQQFFLKQAKQLEKSILQ
ncbi:MAG TPA: hypothetical protein VJB65_02215 [Patescibacteria group bacterium]|nr:hypothetical protein [Patescibacteria group bacterium]